MAVTPNPSTPPIPQPIADLAALTAVALALKQRVEALTTTVVRLSAASTTDAAAADYVLPIASVSELGGVRVDGTTVTVTASVLSAHIDASTIPLPASTPPVMDGTAAVGVSTHYARADHVHPHDTSNPANYQSEGQVALAVATATSAQMMAMAIERTARIAGDAANQPHELVVTGAVPVELVCTAAGEPVYVRV